MANKVEAHVEENALEMRPKEYTDDCLARIGVSPGQKVLDFGCGNGSYAIPAARIVGKRGRVYAIDKNPDALEILRRLASARGLTHIHTINTHEKSQVPLDNESVDVVLLHDALHLIGRKPNQEQIARKNTATDGRLLLREIYRVIKWDGLLSVFTSPLATHTDIISRDGFEREIRSAGFRLERETYRQLISDDGLVEQGHFYDFRKRQTSESALDPFVYDSPSFRTELKEDVHHYGEVTVLEAMAEPGMTVLELGANKGVTAVALAKIVGPRGHVHTFEPVPEYYTALMENLCLNKVDNVTVHQLAVTDKESEISFYKHGEGSGIVQADDAEQIIVGTTSLDNFMAENQTLEQVHLINMDCEGAELLVFRGGKKTLLQDMPHIFCEIHHDYLSRLGQSARDIAEYLRLLGFQVVPVSVNTPGEDVKLESCTHICAVAEGTLPLESHSVSLDRLKELLVAARM
ncbi:MAG: FkbM family methyltransferase [Candidatus Hydrogenedentes bacterium]|nr:FkbM family methyltransferase [Candidatus Hydrogenedentota bacterium]